MVNLKRSVTDVWAKIWKDPVALTALILSLFAAGAQVKDWLRGPSVRLITPEHVALYVDMTPDRVTKFMRVAGEMSYANIAQGPYGTLVVSERVTLFVGQAESHQRWNAFGTITRDGVKQTGTSAPQALPGQSAVTHITLFAPVPIDCPENSGSCEPMRDYLTPSEFAQQVRSAKELRFAFEIKLIGGKVILRTCSVPLKQAAQERLQALLQFKAAYFYATCHPTTVE